MPSSFLEIVELPNGDIVLLRADGEGEPLVNIRFSDESKAYMPDMRMEVARAMIQAGIETAVMLSEENESSTDGESSAGRESSTGRETSTGKQSSSEDVLSVQFEDDDEDSSEPRVLH